MNPALDSVRPKLAKLIPLLSSDKPGEVTATAAAIGRTLKAGGSDWHALAAFIGDVPVPFVYNPPPAHSHPAPPQPTPKPRRRASPWPTFSTLRHSERVAWLDAVGNGPYSWDRDKRHNFEELAKKITQRPHELLSTAEVKLFNRLVKLAWVVGVRP